MANKRLTDLTELTDAADNDFLYIVDVSDTTESAQGTSKKIRKDKVDSGASKENITNKQNDLTSDGTGTKYPTVDAVNTIDLNKVINVSGEAGLTSGDNNLDVEITPTKGSFQSYNSVKSTSIGVNLGELNIQATDVFNNFKTKIGINTPLNSFTTINFPSPIIDGTYTLATTDEISTLDSNVVHKTGDETITGSKSFTVNSINGAINVTNSYGFPAIKVTSTYGIGLSVYNTSSTSGISSYTTGSGTAGEFSTGLGSTGPGMVVSSQSSGNALNLLGSTTTTGKLLNASNNGVSTLNITKEGNLTANSFIKTGGTSTQALMADGSAVRLVSQTITNGVTDKSPSEDAVFDAMANVTRNIIAKSGPNTTLTGTLTNTILKSVLITSNTYSDYDVLNIPSLKFEKTGTNANAIFKIYINTVDSISGATLIGTYTASNTSTLIKMTRSYSLRNGFLIGVIFSASVSSDIGASVSPVSSTAFDVTTNNYLIITGQLGNINDSILLSEIIIQK